MKRMLTFTAFLITIFAASAFPATENGKEDKTSQNEVSVKLVTEHTSTAAAVDFEREKKNTVQPQVSVSVGGAIGVSVPDEDDARTSRPLFPLPPPPPPPPPKNPNVFTRFIDDVFQIPITVLQSVSKLLTNPFTQRNKEKDAASD